MHNPAFKLFIGAVLQERLQYAMGVKMRINPVYKKELKISVRTIKMSLVLLVYNAILMLFGLLAFYIIFGGSNYGRGNYSDILSLYTVISAVEVGLVLFIVPSFTAGAIAGEREKQTLEILLTTRLKPIQIVTGKLASSISTLLLVVVSSLPIMAIVFSIGGINYVDLMQLVFMVFITAIFIGSIGIFFSSIFKKTIVATVFTYGTVLFLTIGTLATLLLALGVMSVNGGDADVGYSVFVLLLNPIVTLMSMMMQQYGGEGYFSSFIGHFSENMIGIESAGTWFVLSVCVQIVLACIFILLAVKTLNPLKTSKRRRKTANKKEKIKRAIEG